MTKPRYSEQIVPVPLPVVISRFLYNIDSKCDLLLNESYQYTNNRRLDSVGDNDRRSESFCSSAVLCVHITWWMVKTRVIILWVIEGPNAGDQIVFCAFDSFLVEVQATLLATYVPCMRNSNLEIRIAGSSFRWQLNSPRDTMFDFESWCLLFVFLLLLLSLFF